MTPLQRSTVQTLQAEGFQITRHQKDMVLMSSGADHRLVRAAGSQRRGNQAAERLERMAVIAEAAEQRT